MKINEVIIKPVLTEKSSSHVARNQYTFEVYRKATKLDITRVVEELFGVEVYKVRVINRRGKRKHVGRTRREKTMPSRRFAVITINPKQKIDLFEVEEESAGK
ncbi:50S ribosomal protein L23 [Patescibacteria group bacterium]|nr:50S ribosomal protein L23 [Patescibacteria group bacterium]